MYHYVYYSYEEWGRGYIGVRSCKCKPVDDRKYLGSFTDKSFKPTNKIILAEYPTRKEAAVAEITLHKFYQVQINYHFANKAKATTEKFSLFGRPRTPEEKRKLSEALKGRKLPEDRRLKFARVHIGRKQSAEWVKKRTDKLKGRKRAPEQRLKMSKGHLGKPLTYLYKPVMLVNNSTGELIYFESQQQAVNELMLSQPNFCNMVAGRRKSCGGYSVFRSKLDRNYSDFPLEF
jgi:hypothetical protein